MCACVCVCVCVLGGAGGGAVGVGYLYLTLLCHHRNDSALRWTCSDVGHFDVSLTHCEGQINTQDSVHKSQRLKRRESRSGESTDVVFNSQPNALPLGQPAPLKRRKGKSRKKAWPEERNERPKKKKKKKKPERKKKERKQGKERKKKERKQGKERKKKEDEADEEIF